jgi:thiol-disulfide isomerase/thioredoxin
MKPTILVNAVTYFFIFLFLYTGGEKLTEIHLFKEQMISSPLLGSMAGFIAWALPITEILLAIVLFVPAWQVKALYASVALMILFTLYLAGILLIDTHLICSCGGIIEQLSPRQHLWFNGACISLALLALLAARRQPGSRQFRWLSGSGSLLLFGSIGWIILTAYRTPAKIKSGFEGRPLPAFSMLLIDSARQLNTQDIPTGKPFIMVGYSPYCGHCQAEMGDIIQHIAQFGDTTIYFVTSFGYSDMKKFYGWFHLEKYPNIVLGVDRKGSFLSYFKSRGVPYTTVYDAKKRLKAVYDGQTDAAHLKKSLDED